MEITHPKLMCVVDDDGIGVGDVNATFYNRRADQNIKAAFDKIVHHLFQLVALHLSMSHANASIWTQALYHACNFLEILNAVIDEKYLATPLYFVANRIANNFFVHRDDLGMDGMAIGRRRLNDAQITRPHE